MFRSVLRDKVEAPWLLSPCNSRGVTVLLVQLKEAHACGDPLVVIKAIAAEHAAMIKQQVCDWDHVEFVPGQASLMHASVELALPTA